jgi:hypothetical protein
MSVTFGRIINDGHRKVVGYASMLVADIPAERFSERPHPTMNHPTFCLGHLSIYPDKTLPLLDHPDLAVERPEWDELFSFRATCEDDSGQYPGKDEIVDFFTERCAVVRDVLDTVDDEVFRRPLPEDHPMRGRMEDVGSVVNFLLLAHPMVHLGQLSAWRRAAGLGQVLNRG